MAIDDDPEEPVAGPPSRISETDIAVLWSDSETRCVLSWMGDRFRLRLVRGSNVVEEQTGAHEAALFAIASRWRSEQREKGGP